MYIHCIYMKNHVYIAHFIVMCMHCHVRSMFVYYLVFHGIKAVLFAERNKMAGLKRLLEAGGAKVYGSGNKYVHSRHT